MGLRYTRAKKRNRFVSFMSAVSILGISLGVTVLITVLSVMNGFDFQIKHKFLEMVPQITVSRFNGHIEASNSQLQTLFKRNPNIQAAAPVIQGEGMLVKKGSSAFSMIIGIEPVMQAKVTDLQNKFIAGSLFSLKTNHFGIILGADTAQRLGLQLHDVVTVVVPQLNVSPFGFSPVVKQFKVVGIFKMSDQFDSGYAFIDIHDAQRLFDLPHQYTAWQLQTRDLFKAPDIAGQLNSQLPSGFFAQDWTALNQAFFNALQMEKTIMFVILLLIIAVAVFNMLSSLVMVVNDKRSEIAILRTLGVTTRQIMLIFVVQGSAIGLLGTLLGLIAGIVLSLNVTTLVNQVQQIFNIQFIHSNVYFINFLPSQLQTSDVWHVGLISLALSFCATIYPAWRAARLQPAEALRYE